MKTLCFSKNTLTKLIVVVLSITLIGLLSGCTSSEDIYYSAKNYSDTTREQLDNLANGTQTTVDLAVDDIGSAVSTAGTNLKHGTGNVVTKLGLGLNRIGWGIIIVSIVIGVVILVATIKSPSVKIKQIAWVVFIAGIPIVTYLLMWLLGGISAGLLK